MKRLELLTPLELWAHRLMGWEYARIWVKPTVERNGWYCLTVRVRDVDGVPFVPIGRTVYVDYGCVEISETHHAPLSDFQHMWLTPRPEEV